MKGKELVKREDVEASHTLGQSYTSLFFCSSRGQEESQSGGETLFLIRYLFSEVLTFRLAEMSGGEIKE